MSSGDGWRHRANLFGAGSLDPLDRWRMDSAQREEARAKERQQQQQERERREQELAHASATEQIVALRAELTALREEHESLRMTVLDCTNVTADAFGTLAGQRMDLSAEQREELRDLKIEVAKIGSTLTELRGRPADFRFAREKDTDAVVELPNPLVRKVTVN
jgi:hypothetical protein